MLLGALPLFHTFGQTCTMNCAVATGATVTMLARFDPEKALEVVERDSVTVFQGVPTMYNALLHARAADRGRVDPPSMHVGRGGDPGRADSRLRGEVRLRGARGLRPSETSPVASFNHPDKERKAGSIGTPIEGVEMQVWDDQDNALPAGEVGEIVIRGHNVMTGYWERPTPRRSRSPRRAGSARATWRKVDEDGYFFIVDRKKDMIIRGGYNVYPREVEEVLYEHPAVQEAAVVGVPDDALGEEVAAAVVVCKGEQAEAAELRGFVRERIAAYKYPRKIWFIDELPKGLPARSSSARSRCRSRSGRFVGVQAAGGYRLTQAPARPAARGDYPPPGHVNHHRYRPAGKPVRRLLQLRSAGVGGVPGALAPLVRGRLGGKTVVEAATSACCTGATGCRSGSSRRRTCASTSSPRRPCSGATTWCRSTSVRGEWLEEGTLLFGHPRDPYHRRAPHSRRVRVSIGGEVVAQ